MDRSIAAALALLVFGVVAAGTGATAAPAVRVLVAGAPTPARDGSGDAPSCGPGMFPDGNACVHLPGEDEGEDAPVLENAHRARSGRWALYDQIPRRPDRPASYDAYRYPVPPGLPGGHFVVSGYDLDRPDATQRRGWSLRAVGHGGVDLPDPRGTPITLVALEHQQGDAEVVYVGPLFGITVVTRHTVREGGQLRDYLLLFGHLERAAPGLASGARLREGDPIGQVGDTGSPELVHLHLEARRVRDGVDVAKTPPGRLLDSSVSVVCDPRNVLPLKV